MKVNDKYDVCHIVIENNPNPSKFTEAFKNTALSHSNHCRAYIKQEATSHLKEKL